MANPFVPVRTIRQTVRIKASPRAVFDAFMDAARHRDFTGFTASIDPRVGGKFTTCGDRNFGYTLFLDPAKHIVQAWAHIDFPKGHFSVVDIMLERTSTGCIIHFQQSTTPAECVSWLKPGWRSTYWVPLKAYLELGTRTPRRK